MSEKRQETTVVHVKFDIPAFKGPDMQTYGPFKVGDAAIIPKAYAAFLIEKGLVSLIDEMPKKEESDLAPADHSLKSRTCNQMAETENDSTALKRQLEELAAQVGKIATRMDLFESYSPSAGSRKRFKDKNRCIVYLDKECMQIIEPFRRSPNEKTKDVLKRCLLWFNENLKMNQNHQNDLQKSLDS